MSSLIEQHNAHGLQQNYKLFLKHFVVYQMFRVFQIINKDSDMLVAKWKRYRRLKIQLDCTVLSHGAVNNG